MHSYDSYMYKGHGTDLSNFVLSIAIIASVFTSSFLMFGKCVSFAYVGRRCVTEI